METVWSTQQSFNKLVDSSVEDKLSQLDDLGYGDMLDDVDQSEYDQILADANNLRQDDLEDFEYNIAPDIAKQVRDGLVLDDKFNLVNPQDLIVNVGNAEIVTDLDAGGTLYFREEGRKEFPILGFDEDDETFIHQLDRLGILESLHRLYPEKDYLEFDDTYYFGDMIPMNWALLEEVLTRPTTKELRGIGESVNEAVSTKNPKGLAKELEEIKELADEYGKEYFTQEYYFADDPEMSMQYAYPEFYNVAYNFFKEMDFNKDKDSDDPIKNDEFKYLKANDPAKLDKMLEDLWYSVDQAAWDTIIDMCERLIRSKGKTVQAKDIYKTKYKSVLNDDEILAARERQEAEFEESLNEGYLEEVILQLDPDGDRAFEVDGDILDDKYDYFGGEVILEDDMSQAKLKEFGIKPGDKFRAAVNDDEDNTIEILGKIEESVDEKVDPELKAGKPVKVDKWEYQADPKVIKKAINILYDKLSEEEFDEFSDKAMDAYIDKDPDAMTYVKKLFKKLGLPMWVLKAFVEAWDDDFDESLDEALSPKEFDKLLQKGNSEESDKLGSAFVKECDRLGIDQENASNYSELYKKLDKQGKEEITKVIKSFKESLTEGAAEELAMQGLKERVADYFLESRLNGIDDNFAYDVAEKFKEEYNLDWCDEEAGSWDSQIIATAKRKLARAVADDLFKYAPRELGESLNEDAYTGLLKRAKSITAEKIDALLDDISDAIDSKSITKEQENKLMHILGINDFDPFDESLDEDLTAHKVCIIDQGREDTDYTKYFTDEAKANEYAAQLEKEVNGPSMRWHAANVSIKPIKINESLRDLPAQERFEIGTELQDIGSDLRTESGYEMKHGRPADNVDGLVDELEADLDRIHGKIKNESLIENYTDFYRIRDKWFDEESDRWVEDKESFYYPVWRDKDTGLIRPDLVIYNEKDLAQFLADCEKKNDVVDLADDRKGKFPKVFNEVEYTWEEADEEIINDYLVPDLQTALFDESFNKNDEIIGTRDLIKYGLEKGGISNFLGKEGDSFKITTALEDGSEKEIRLPLSYLKYFKKNESLTEEIWHNRGAGDCKIIERSSSGRNALLKRLADGAVQPYVIALNMGKDSWGQGKYFSELEDAKREWKRYKFD